MKKKPKYKRILLKLSGEALLGRREFGIDAEVIGTYAGEIAAICPPRFSSLPRHVR